jgi:SOS-response transcriptional repressor LexA
MHPSARAFPPTGDTAIARVAGDGLRAFDVRDGDHVVLARRPTAEHGDLAAILDTQGRACLWKVYPDGDGFRLSMGHPAFERRSAPGACVQGVVVAILRQLPDRADRAELADEPCE